MNWTRALTGPLLVALAACRAAPPAEHAELRAVLDELYVAFNFDPGAEPDWATQRRIYLEGAVFVPPMRAGSAPRADDTEAFLAGFRDYVNSEPYRTTGFHERIIGVRAEAFGGVAHAFVAFEGFAPGDGVTRTRGLDSLQFVRAGDTWKLVSFATQYEGAGLALPPRFVDDAGAAD